MATKVQALEQVNVDVGQKMRVCPKLARFIAQKSPGNTPSRRCKTSYRRDSGAFFG